MYFLDPEYIVKIKDHNKYQAEITSGRNAILFIVIIFLFVRQSWISYSCYLITVAIWSYKKILSYNSLNKCFYIDYSILLVNIRRKKIPLQNIKGLLLGYFIPDTTGEQLSSYELLFQTNDDKDISIGRRSGYNILNRIGKDISGYLPDGIEYKLMMDR